jgi:hypothetical protein
MRLLIPHNHGKEEALKRVRTALQEAHVQHGDKVSDVHESWADNVGTCSFRAMGFKVEAQVTVGEGKIPFMLRGMQSKISAMLIENVRRVLA